MFPLPNGGALKLTIGEYFPPSKERVQPGVGLTPSLHCVATPHVGEVDPCIARAAAVARARATELAASTEPAAAGQQATTVASAPSPSGGGTPGSDKDDIGA